MQKQSTIGLIVKNAGIDTLGTAFNLVFAFASGLIITRTIGADDFGKYSVSSSVFRVVAILAIFGLNTGIVKLVSSYNAKGDNSRVKGALVSGVRLTLLFSILLIVAIYLTSPIIATRIFKRIEGIEWVLRIHILALPFFAMMSLFNAYTQGLKTLKYSVTVEMIARPAIRLGIVIILFLVGLRLFGVIFGSVASYLIGALLAYYFARRISPFDYGKMPAQKLTKEILTYSLPLVLANFMNVIIIRSDIIMLGFFKDSISTGIYGATQILAPFVSLSLISFSKIFAPVASELWETKRKEELGQHLKTISKWILSIGLPVFLLYQLYAPTLLTIFGNEFAHGAKSLKILATGQLINAAVGPVGFLLVMTGRQKLNLVNSVVVAASNIILNALFIPRWGIEGAALATAISTSTVNLARVIQVKAIYGFTPFRKDFAKPLIAGAISYVAFMAVNYYLGWSGLGHVIILCGAFLTLYLVLSYLLGLKDEIELIKEIISRR